MKVRTPDTEKLLRQVIASVALLPPGDLMVVYETINDLKQKDKPGNPVLTSDEILSRARARALELSHLSHEEIAQRFIDTTEKIRAEAIKKGTAIEGEWKGD